MLELMEHPYRRPDPLKVFLGNLRPNVIKPEVMGFLTRQLSGDGFLNPVDVIVPPNHGPVAIAFAIFDSPAEADDCIALCNGAADDISIDYVLAHRGANMRVFIAVVIACHRTFKVLYRIYKA